MKTKFIPILGVAGLALSGLSAHAQIAYNDGDLILDFSQSGASDVEVDLGSLASLNLLSGGSSVQIGSFSSYLTTAGSSLQQFVVLHIRHSKQCGRICLGKYLLPFSSAIGCQSEHGPE